jgi:hypothetical protein
LSTSRNLAPSVGLTTVAVGREVVPDAVFLDFGTLLDHSSRKNDLASLAKREQSGELLATNIKNNLLGKQQC